MADESSGPTEGEEEGMSTALQAVLVSPNFLYRNEFGPSDGEYRL